MAPSAKNLLSFAFVRLQRRFRPRFLTIVRTGLVASHRFSDAFFEVGGRLDDHLLRFLPWTSTTTEAVRLCQAKPATCQKVGHATDKFTLPIAMLIIDL